MARLLVLLAAAMFLSLGLSACTDAGAKTDPNDSDDRSVVAPGEPVEDGGSIEGVVTTEDAQPLSNAVVGLVELSLQANTAEDGSFAFQQIPAGTYQIAAQMLGYESQARKIEVVAGESTNAVFQLMAIEIVEGWHTTQTKSGFLACGMAVRASTTRTAVEPCAQFSGTGTAVDDLEEFIVDFQPTSGKSTDLATILGETQWTPSQVLSKGLTVYWENYRTPAGPGLSTCPCVGFGSVQGTSPLRVAIDEDAIGKAIEGKSPHCMKDQPCRLRARTFPYADGLGPNSPVDLAVYVNQRFTHWMTEFYHEPAPEGFTVLTDA